MTLSLRQRRQRETARDIQRVTLELAVATGLHQVTTEAIAKAAGVSTRTFFNYYTNKEAAAIGTLPGFDPEDMVALREGSAPLAEDLKRFLTQHIKSLATFEDILRMVRTVVRENTNARGVLDSLLMEQCDEVADCLHARVKDRAIAATLADNAVRCTARAIDLWENDKRMSLIGALDRVWADQIAAARCLIGASD